MATTPITIAGTTIQFPLSGADPNWSPAVILFAQLVAQALSGVVGPFDVSPQIFDMTANVNTNVSLPNLAFPTSEVRGAFIRYSVFRQTSSTSGSETGTLVATYNPNNPVNQKWEMTRTFAGNNANITFTITDTGQVQFSTTVLAGTSHVGIITYSAQATLNS